ncbi:glucose-inducible SAM-dependent methyltransferase [Rhodotorula toruloides]|uniref:Glucose-inducible SAM-dependent methyltransferase n=1 Tax=Rhodotorula toruloides TaxID=5286 RepID=A0A511KKC5_RHOTO|nr:glucose-inducible SAM-dependent methyltransferase [Rhodotorula toruloides]
MRRGFWRAQGSLTKTYLLPRPTGHLDNPQRTSSFAYPTPPPTRPASTVPFERFSPPPHSAIPPADISLTVRDGTLVEASTGHRTWGAASLFSHRLASSSSSYLPFAPSNRSLRVLELGSGTGLVGLAAAKVLEALDVPARVVLSDGGDEPDTVLANLRENVEANFPPADSAASCVKVTSERLDWRDYLPSSPSIRAVSHMRQERYDLLLGTDLAYERGQATLLHAAVAVLLRFPSSAPSRDEPNPVFWLTVALRPTHTAEIAEVDSLFPSSSISSSVNPALLRTHDGKLYRLVSTATEDVVGPDGFAGRAVRGKMGARGEMRYRIYRVEWEEMRG